MNHDLTLHQEIRKISDRYARLFRRSALAVFWLVMVLAGFAALATLQGALSLKLFVASILVLAAEAALLVVGVGRAFRRVRDPLWIARKIETRFPQLDSRLLAALEQRPDEASGNYSFLQESVITQALDHSSAAQWETIVAPGKLRAAGWAQWGMLTAFLLVALKLAVAMQDHPGRASAAKNPDERAGSYVIKVDPEDADVERGAAMLVTARFSGRMPDDSQLIYRDAKGDEQLAPMSRSLNDPLFASRIASVAGELTYAVRYADQQTRWYKVSVFDYPDLKKADVKLDFPKYTELPQKLVEDTRSVTAVEGTTATLLFRLNKAVAAAQLLPTSRPSAKSGPQTQPAESPVKLTVDATDPTLYTAKIDMRQSQRFTLDVVDERGRKMKLTPELALNVTPNKPANVQLTFPGKDVDASPIQELTLKARVSDDFGVRRVGVSYSMAGQPLHDVVLGENLKGRQDVTQLIALEKLKAEPDQLLSYYFWAEDTAADGSVRRTAGDMYFAEVRPFEEIYRQGQQPAGGEQQQQQQQQQGQPNGNAQDAEELADLQKQIIGGTWTVIRREINPRPTDKLVPDSKLLSDSQGDAREQANALQEKLTDARSRTFLQNVFKYMEQARTQLDDVTKSNMIDKLPTALASEQAAYQELLKLRAREFEVTRQNRQQGQRQQRASAQNRRQRQLNQLSLDQEENRYQTQRNANSTPSAQQDAPQRETRQVLNRLRELAQRQEDLNKQMRELQSALQQARDPQQRQELDRQLARLRDQQQQQLRDADELRDRMAQPENQEQMADSRQQLEQSREDVRRAAEALDRQNVADAQAAGARAGEQLNDLRDQFRRESAGQFNDAVSQLREQARKLDQQEHQLSDELASAAPGAQAGRTPQDPKAQQRDAQSPDGQQREGQPQSQLRTAGDDKPIAQRLTDQKQQLDQLMDNTRKIIENAETPEPLLSQKLYDTVRQSYQQQPDRALQTTKDLVERGLNKEARESEADAGKGIAQLRQGIEQAAQGVLGDDAEALRRARNQLDQLSQQLDREFGPEQPGRGTTRPGGASQQARSNEPTTRNSLARADDPTDRGASQRGNRGQSNDPNSERANSDPSGRGGQRDAQARGGNARGNPSEEQTGEQADNQQGNQQARAGENPTGRNGQRGAQARSGNAQGNPPEAQPGQQAGNQRGNQQGRAGRNGGRRGNGQSPDGNPNAATPDDSQVAQAGGERQANTPGARRGASLRQNDQTEEGQTPGDQPQQGPPADGNNRGGGAGRRGGEPRDAVAQGGAAGNRQNNDGPFTGGDFRQWSDQLRDVEEMVNDPQLRQQAAQIRDRATAIRNDITQHSKQPNWNVVTEMVRQPLIELRNAVNDELLRRESAEALVPIDREPVPPEYTEQVRNYYEKLGSGK